MQNPLRLREMFRAVAFNQRYRPRKDHSVAARHAVNKFVFRQCHAAARFEFARSERGIYISDRRVFYALNAAHHRRLIRHRPIRRRRRVIRHLLNSPDKNFFAQIISYGAALCNLKGNRKIFWLKKFFRCGILRGDLRLTF